MSLCIINEDGIGLVENIEFLNSGGLEHIMGAGFELLVLELFDYFLAFDYFLFKGLVFPIDFLLELLNSFLQLLNFCLFLFK